MAKALISAGLASPLKKRRQRYKKFKCARCNADMIHTPDSNIMTCTNCDNYYLFDKVM